MLQITAGVRIPDSEIEISAVRAQGPGGQNVNKVATAVVLRFDSQRSSLPERYRAALAALPDRRVSRDGVVTIKAQRYRSQERNREDALMRLRDLVRASVASPPRRVPTAPSAAARARRLEAKRRRSGLKSLRRQPPGND